jgi:hypothetical protein
MKKYPITKTYVPAKDTNVMATWKRFGFIPPSEMVEFKKKWLLIKRSSPQTDTILG